MHYYSHVGYLLQLVTSNEALEAKIEAKYDADETAKELRQEIKQLQDSQEKLHKENETLR